MASPSFPAPITAIFVFASMQYLSSERKS